MPADEEELFGPVAAVIPVKNDEAAIAAANDSVFGLGASVLTTDLARGERIAVERIESGSVFVNEVVRSDRGSPSGVSRRAAMDASSPATASGSSSTSRLSISPEVRPMDKGAADYRRASRRVPA